MSWEAVAWANKQRMRLPQEQLVLLVLANCADPEGVAFAQWRGREHWWKYLVERTRLSRASVFRHLSTIEELGLGTRSTLLLADGTKRPTLHLDLAKVVDQTAFEEDAPDTSEPETQSHSETTEPVGQSHHETEEIAAQSHSETGPVSPVRLHIESNKDSNSPPTPSRGVDEVIDEGLEQDVAEAQRLYPDPITNLPRFRAAMAALQPAERHRVLGAIRGYAAYIAECQHKGKSRPVKDAHLWVANGLWQGYAVAGERAAAVAEIQQVPVDSPSGKAWLTLHKIAGLSDPLATGGHFRIKHAMGPRALAFAEPPPEAAWAFISEASHNQVAAWRAFLGETLDKPLGFLIRHRSWRGTEKIVERGFLAPWPWPPRKDGTLSSTGPPDTLMTEQDERDTDQLGKLTG